MEEPPFVLPAGTWNLALLVSCFPGHKCCHFSEGPCIGEVEATFCLRCPLVLDAHLFLSVCAGGVASLPRDAFTPGHMDVSKTVSRPPNYENQLSSLPPSFPSVPRQSLSTDCVPGTFQMMGTEQWSKQISRCPHGAYMLMSWWRERQM